MKYEQILILNPYVDVKNKILHYIVDFFAMPGVESDKNHRMVVT